MAGNSRRRNTIAIVAAGEDGTRLTDPRLTSQRDLDFWSASALEVHTIASSLGR